MELITQNKLTMSREIKFRAWDGKKYYYQDDQYLSSFIWRFVRDVNYENGLNSEHEAYLKNHLNDYLQQYTGLTDKNSIEIYEGDVVEAKTVERSPIAPDYVSGYLKGVIEYYDNAFCIKYKDRKGQYIYNHLWTNAEEWRVLGNIHEHPHLMEQ